ncbi:hypothetical protein OAA09_00295 [bacterium]|nr:hypothetical protein [bacterium]
MNKIALMCGYFGGRPSDNKGNVYRRPDGTEINGIWPLELPAFLVSCSKNPSIDWKIVTNLEIPQNVPENVHFIKIELEEMFERFKRKVGIDLPFTNLKKMGDVKATYGIIFDDIFEGYDFWGLCDMDIIWGDIRSFITEDMLSEYDIISSRENWMSGHFTLYRNIPGVSDICRYTPDFANTFSQTRYRSLDEVQLTNFLNRRIIKKDGTELKVLMKKLQHDAGETIPGQSDPESKEKWEWNNGKVYRLSKNDGTIEKNPLESMYVHLIHWKFVMDTIEFQYNDKINKMLITKEKIEKG